MPQTLASTWWALALFGLFIGVFAGLFGLGGGAVLVPLLVLVFKLGQKAAHGTSLAIILSPAAAPAIWKYHKAGAVEWRLVLFIAPFMLIGSYFGAWLATGMSQSLLRSSFAFVLIYVAGYLIFAQSSSIGRAVVLALVPAVLTGLLGLFTGAFRTVETTSAPAAPEAQTDAPGPSEGESL